MFHPKGLKDGKHTVHDNVPLSNRHLYLVDICQLRLDFDTFYLGVSTAGACSDTLAIVGPSFAPGHTLCGTLTGSHSKLYLNKELIKIVF